MDDADRGLGERRLTATSISDRLACFNAKERWWLLRHMMGDDRFAPRHAVVAECH
jgi:hypothetical protein